MRAFRLSSRNAHTSLRLLPLLCSLLLPGPSILAAVPAAAIPVARPAAAADDAALPAAPVAQSCRLSGTITAPSGAPIPNATVSLTGPGSPTPLQLQTTQNGAYTARDLAPGNYHLAILASGFAQAASDVTLAAGSEKSIDLALSPEPATPQAGSSGNQTSSPSPQTPSDTTQTPSNTTQAPSSSNAPSLSDLGLTPGETKANPAEQARLDKRTHMLKVHQKLGLITLVPMAATLFSSGGAKNYHGHDGNTTATTNAGNTTGMDVHAAIGGVTVAMYAATAYYAIAAPRIPGTETKGAIRVHKALIWIHGPGMVLTPILGVMAFQQEDKGEKVHGLAAAHAPVAWATVLAYGASIISVSWPIKLPF
jgi:hypothetical protein